MSLPGLLLKFLGFVRRLRLLLQLLLVGLFSKIKAFIKFVDSKLDERFKKTALPLTLGMLSILIPVFILVVKNAQKVEAGWFDDRFKYRKSVAISYSGTADLTDYQVEIVGAIPVGCISNKVKVDGSDVRFTDINGNQLSFWIEGNRALRCDTFAQDIWVKVPSIPVGGTTVYMYYGNPNAINASNGNNTFEYFDDFNDTSEIILNAGGGTLRTANGALALTNNATAWDNQIYTKQNFARRNDMSFRTTIFSATSGPIQNPAFVGLTNITLNSTASVWTDYIYGIYATTSSPSQFAVYEDTNARVGGTSSYTASTFTDIRIDLKEVGAQYFIKGDTATSWTSFYNSTYSSQTPLKFGFVQYPDTYYTILYNWYLTKYAPTEPSAASPGTEEVITRPVVYYKFDDGLGLVARNEMNQYFSVQVRNDSSTQLDIMSQAGGYSQYNNSQRTIASKWGYSSEAAFTSTANWDALDFSALTIDGVSNFKGYSGAVFDGRYVYFVPRYDGTNYHGKFLRYDTTQTFATSSLWDAIDIGTFTIDGVASLKGYDGGTFDGRYIYFSPSYDGSAYSGKFLRYDTTKDFTSTASWNALNFSGMTLDGITTVAGYKDASFDGRYVYFAPEQDGTSFTGEMLRYDTSSSFLSTASWDVINIEGKSLPGNALGLEGLTSVISDGKKLYYLGGINSVSSGPIASYDFYSPGCTGTFDGNNSVATCWNSYQLDTATVDGVSGMKGYYGAGFDGRYVYFSPLASSAPVYHGKMLRYDTTLSLTSTASWDAFDMGALTVDSISNFKGYTGAVFDGKYLYYVPYAESALGQGKMLRYDTTGTFASTAFWDALDLSAGTVDGVSNFTGYSGGVFDGRYIYYVPYYTSSVYHGKMLRYDTLGGAAGSYSLDYSNSSGSRGLVPGGPTFKVATSSGLRTISYNTSMSAKINLISANYDGTTISLAVNNDTKSYNYGSSAAINTSTAPLRVQNTFTGNTDFNGTYELSHHGALNAQTQWSSEGLTGGALSFNGTSDFVYIDALNNINSISLWVKPAILNQTILDLGGTNTTISSDANGTVTAGAGFTTPTVYVNGSTGKKLKLNTWNNIIVTTGTALTTTGATLGQSGSNYYKGLMDEVKFFVSVLNSNQIKAETSYTLGSGAGESETPSNYDLSNGLLGYWKMDEGIGTSGPATDSSGNAISLTNNNNSPYVAGKYGLAYTGSSPASYYLSTGSTFPSVKSVSFWVIPSSTSTGLMNFDNAPTAINFSTTNDYLLIKGLGLTDANVYINGAQATTQLSGSDVITSSVTPGTGVWWHVVITSKAGFAADNFTIARSGASTYLDGLIDDVRLYNRTLGGREAENLYFKDSSTTTMYLDFNEGSGMFLGDKSANNNDATTFSISHISTAMTELTWVGNGKFGNAINFSGANNYAITQDSSSLDLTDSMAVSAWINPDTVNSDMVIADKKGAYSLRIGKGRASFGVDTISNILDGVDGIVDVFYYDTTTDSVDAKTWRYSSTKSWYSEAADAGCSTIGNFTAAGGSADRCGSAEFPEKAILVVTASALYIYDAEKIYSTTTGPWMRFDQGTNYTLGVDANNNPSVVYALNGKVYVGLNGSSADGLRVIDFSAADATSQTLYKYVAGGSGKQVAAEGIVSRNSALTWATATAPAILSSNVYDIYPTVIGGKTYVSAATTSGVSVLNLTDPIGFTILGQTGTWNYRRTLVVDQAKVSGSSDFTDFTIPVSGTYADWATTANGGYMVQADAGDIAFTDVNGTNLDYQIESYVATTGALVAWVQVPTLYGAANTTLYMYCGNATVGEMSNPTGTWEASYGAVFHLAETPPNGGSIYDATSNANTGTLVDANANTNTNYSAVLNGGDDFNGDADYETWTDSDSLSKTTSMTVAGWWNQDALAVNQIMASKWTWNASKAGWSLETGNSDNTIIRILVAASNTDTGSNLGGPATGSWTTGWHHVAFVYNGAGAANGDKLKLYLDGALKAMTFSGTMPTSMTNNAATFNIGRFDGLGRYWNGKADEITVSGAIRSADFIATTYNSQTSPSTFYAMGNAEITGVSNYSDNASDDYASVWLTNGGELYAVNAATAALERWDDITSVTTSEVAGTPHWIWDETNSPAKVAALNTGVAPTISSSPGQLYVTENTNAWYSGLPTVFWGQSNGVVQLSVTPVSSTPAAQTFGASASGTFPSTWSANYWGILTGYPFTTAGYVNQISYYSQNASEVVKFRIYRNDGTRYVSVGDTPWVTTSSGANTYTIPNNAVIHVNSGDYVGLYSSSALENWWNGGGGSGVSLILGYDSGPAIIGSWTSTAAGRVTIYANVVPDTSPASVKYITKDYITEDMPGDIRAMWSMYEATGATVNDLSVNANDLTLYNTPTWNTSAGSYVRNNSLLFDGTNEYALSANNSDLLGDPEFTISAWINVPTSPTVTGTYAPILWWGPASAGTCQAAYFGLYGADPQSVFVGFTGSGMAATKVLSLASWHHLVWVRSAANGSQSGSKLFVDGVETNLDTIVGTVCYPNLRDGKYEVQRGGTPGYMQYNLDELAVYGIALSNSQVQRIYESGRRALLSNSTNALYGATNTITSVSAVPIKDSVYKIGSPHMLYLGTTSGMSQIDLSSDTLANTYTSASTPAIKDEGVVSISPINAFSVVAGVNDANDAVSVMNNISGDSAIPTNKWTHVMGVYDDTTGEMRLYQDSALQGKSPMTITVPTSPNNLIFSGYDVGSYYSAFFDGRIDEFQILNYVPNVRTRALVFSTHRMPYPMVWLKLDSLIGGFTYDEISQTAFTVTGATTSVGVIRTAYSFDGTGDYITDTDDNLGNVGSADFSISAWFKHPNEQVGANRFIVGKYSEAGYKLYINTDEKLCLGIDDDATYGPDNSICTTVTYNDAAWHHIVARRINGKIDIYIDAKAASGQTTITATNTLDGTGHIYVGADTNGSNGIWSGNIDELKIFNYSLSSEEIREDYNNMASLSVGRNIQDLKNTGTAYTSPTAYWSFDENSGSTAYDASGAINATLGSGDSAPAWTQQAKFGKALDFDGINDYVSIGDTGMLDVTTNFAFSAWVSGDVNAANGATQTIVAKWNYPATASFTNTANYEHINLATKTANAIGYTAGVYDGRYVYMMPYFRASNTPHGNISRYDTTLSFTSTASWEVFNTETVNANAKGYWFGAFDGRYVYASPYSSLISRYDTTKSFSSTASWEVFDPGSYSPFSASQEGTIFDGTYMYLVPYGGGTRSGVVQRYDTRLSFTSTASWDSFDTTGINANAKGYGGGFFDGRYMYFVQYSATATTTGGRVARYDTKKDFHTNTSWEIFDATTANANSKGFLSVSSDGRYIYIGTYSLDGSTQDGDITRYDTTQPFSSTASWVLFDPSTVNASLKSFLGASFDGKYMYFLTSYEPAGGSVKDGWIARYDTTLSFTSTASWASINAATANAAFNGFNGVVTDGRYIYSPQFTNTAAYVGDVMRFDTQGSTGGTTSPAASYSLNYSNSRSNADGTPYGLSFTIVPPTGLRTITYNGLLPSPWNHVMGTYDGTTVALYLNGLKVASRTYSGVLAATTTPANLTIGNSMGGSSLFKGKIDELRFYNYIPSQNQLMQDVSGNFANTVRPVAYWSFDEGAGQTVRDSHLDNFRITCSMLDGTLGSSATTTTNDPDWTGVGSSDPTACSKGHCLTFVDSNSDYISVGASYPADIKTVSFWVKLGSTKGNTYYIMDLDGGTHTVTIPEGVVTANGFATPTVYVNGKPTTAILGSRDGTWNHVVITTATAISQESLNITLGKISTNYFDGGLDEVSMYGYTLSASEVKELYNGGAMVFK